MIDDKEYDDIALKAVTYPLILVLHGLLDELFAFKSTDTDKGALAILEWSDRLTSFAVQASEAAECYAENLGFSTGCSKDDGGRQLSSKQAQDDFNLSQ